MQLPEWLTAIGTIGLALVAVFQDKIRSWVRSPKLELSIKTQPPDCHKTRMHYRRIVPGTEIEAPTIVDCYYFRVRVKNVGEERAIWAEVFAAELVKERADGTYVQVESFLPMNLLWSNIHTPFFEAISPGMEKHCDLAHILDPKGRGLGDFEDNPKLGVPSDKTLLSLDLQARPYTLSHLLAPGRYRLTLIVAASNARPVKKVLQVNITGEWYDDEEKMLREGIGITI